MSLLLFERSILSWLILSSVLMTFSAGQTYDPCTSLTTCGECIRVPNCVWCYKTMNQSEVSSKINEDMIRCKRRDAMVDCHSDFLIDPVPSYRTIVDIITPRAIFRESNIQLRPEKAILKDLRVGQEYNITLQFKVAKDYPLDLYYMMDVSLSMKEDKKNLVKLADSLAKELSSITENFKLGFGSFLDKNLVPFVKSTGESCGSDEFECGATYSFQHQLSLSTNVEEFKNKVNSTSVILSFDRPEGGFDALVQAIVCQDQIGWGNQSRRLIVFTTDDYSHMAGNGRIGGIVRPNDGLCHLNDENGKYTEAEVQDYPSLGQIGRLVKDYAINLIFAVTQDVAPVYSAFGDMIEGASVGKLDSDSENIVELIRSTYLAISSSVELKDTAGPGIKVRYFTSCTGATLHENNKCDGLKVGTTVNFTISIEVLECPVNQSDWKQTLRFYPVGVNEVMNLDLEMICDCPCERSGHPDNIANASECNGSGDLQCGVCLCDESHSGHSCECSGDLNFAELESQCKVDNSSSILCSGRGGCVCGKCECNRRNNPSEVFSGKFCECDNFSCERGDGLLCSGNGECICGECVCYDGWKGVSCGCRSSQDTCTPKDGGEVCSGNGVCICGACDCSPNARGNYCQDCPTCPSRCEEFQPCVQCKVFQTGPYEKNKECDNLCTYSINIEDLVQVESASERDCSYVNDKQCTVKYVYGFDANTGAKRVRVQREPVCSEPVPVLAIGAGLLGAILLGGLILLLLFKISTYLYDKKQYANFLKDQKNSTWRNDNPLFVEPTTTFKNPAYGN